MPSPNLIFRKLGLVAALAAFVWPILVAFFLRDNIREVWIHPHGDGRTREGFVFATALVIVSLAVQSMAILRLIRGEEGSEEFAARVAVFHGGVALTILGIASLGKPMTDWFTTSSWFLGWVSPYDTREWVPNPFPLLVLAQWVFCAFQANRSKLEIWRGIAIGCLSFTALMGVWTFSPAMGQGWSPLKTSVSAFFSVGVGIHCLAILLIALRWRFAWIWTGIVGFGCLISGFMLSLGFNGDIIMFGGFGDARPKQSFEIQMGTILHFGWFEIGTMLPPIAYALVAWASVVFFLSRSELVPEGASAEPIRMADYQLSVRGHGS